jgi:[ribosomal protein S5]-alanine N-acetyltransferase
VGPDIERPPFPEFLTPRLELRKLCAVDEEFLVRLDADPVVMEHIHTGPLAYAEALRYAHMQVEAAESRYRWGKWLAVLRAGAVPVGWVELCKRSGPDRDDLQVGYEFAPEHWGRGYATEAVARVLEYAFAELKLDRVAAVVRLANTASLHVLDKLGFRQVGHRRNDGRPRCDEYRLAQEDWQQCRVGWGG